MGSFNTSCGLSNLTIEYGDKLGVMFLAPAPTADRHGIRALQGTSMNTYVHDNYHPVLPPIFGEYDDYGGIENVVDTPTARLFAQRFDRPAAEVIECAGNRDRAIYSPYGSIFPTYFPKDKQNSFKDYSTSDLDKIRLLGFTEEPAPEGSLNLFTYEEYALEQVENGKWRLYKNDSPRPIAEFFEKSWDDVASIFAHHTKCYPGFEKKHWKIIRQLYSYSVMHFSQETFEKMREFIIKDDDSYEVKHRKHELFELGEWMKNFDVPEDETPEQKEVREFNLSYIGGGLDHLFRVTAFTSDQFKELEIYRDDLEDFYNMSDILLIAGRLNRPLAPALYSSQEGNDKMVEVLFKVQKGIIAARRKRREDWD